MRTAPAQGRDTAVVGLCEEPDVLVQDFSLRHATWAVLSPMLLKLVRYDERWRPWPELAASIPTFAGGDCRELPDGRVEVRWRLRPGLRWHDGAPVTADDALFTYELLTATPPPYPHHTIIESISEMFVDPADSLALVVRWRADKPFARHEEWGTVLPRHLLGGAGLHDPEVREAHPFLRAPVLQGPYRFVEWLAGSQLAVEAAGSHPVGGTPRIRRLVFRFFDEPEKLAAALAEGEVDVADLTGFEPRHVADLEAQAPELSTWCTPSMLWEHVDMNCADPVLSDRRVRQAVAYAVDREEIAERLYLGRQPVAHSWLPPRHPAANPHVRRYACDPGRARALLAEAGYTPDADGWLRDPSGSPLRLHLLTTASGGGERFVASSTRPQVAEMLRAQLARAGIALDVELAPSDEAFPRFRRRSFPQLAMFAWSMGLETTGYLLWHSSKIPDDDEWYGINVSGWRCAASDALLDRAIAEHDQGRRHALVREHQAVWAEEVPALGLFFPVSVAVAKPGLRGVKPVGVFGCYVTWNAWEWSWDGTGAAP